MVKSNRPRMHPLSSFGNLFHVSMWVLAVACLFGCDSPRPPIEVHDVALPESHQVVNWMAVLDSLPLDEPRARQWSHLHDVHPSFWEVWCEDILQLGAAQDTSSTAVLEQFLSEMKPMLDAIDTTSGHPTVLDRESTRLLNGLKRYSTIQPNAVVPDVVWMPSGFNFAVYPGEEWLAVGLDWFMGSEHPMHAELPPSRFPAYRLQRMNHERMAIDALIGWIAVQQQGQIVSPPRTVDMWLFWGKVMHAASRCLPNASSAELMSWTEDEWAWAVANERAIWAEMQPQDRMFAKTPKEVMRWFQEGPFTRVGRVPQTSPDRLGVFLGWRAIQAALEDRPDWTDTDVLEWTEPEPILRAYRP